MSTFIQIKCDIDNCKEAATFVVYGERPKGWLVLWRHPGPTSGDDEVHFCPEHARVINREIPKNGDR